jgi:transcriptional regulator with XRE-family HTH domain
MRGTSLRQLAKQIGVSHSYLSQVINGKRPASEKVAYRLTKEGILCVNGKQVVSSFTKQQLVEKTLKKTYNESVSGSNSAVECLLPKQKVASSNLVSRSNAQSGKCQFPLV